MMKNDLSVIIPVRNEIIHIERSIKSALCLTPHVYVVDSSSSDGTIEKAISLGAKVFQYEWGPSSSFSDKMNWALKNLPIKTQWILRLDADEYFMDKTIEELSVELAKLDPQINGVTLNRRIHFLGRWMKHSGQYPRPMLRVTRLGYAQYEARLLDEHVLIEGNRIANLSLDFIDENLSSISTWIQKHDKYSTLQAIELLHLQIGLFERQENIEIDLSLQKLRKRKYFYSQLPTYWRPFMYFFFRHIIKLGFLDGYQGFLWNFLQAWWYNTVVDIKIQEIRKVCGNDKMKIKRFLKDKYLIEI